MYVVEHVPVNVTAVAHSKRVRKPFLDFCREIRTCAALAEGPNPGVTQTISVDEMYRTRPPSSPTTWLTSSSTYVPCDPPEDVTPPNLHFKYFDGKKLVPVTVTSVFPPNGPRAGHLLIPKKESVSLAYGQTGRRDLSNWKGRTFAVASQCASPWGFCPGTGT
jgi:hypothetical protein